MAWPCCRRSRLKIFAIGLPSKSVDFIKRYISPGSFHPVSQRGNRIDGKGKRASAWSSSPISAPVMRLTLKAWRERFEAAWSEIAAMGFR